MPAVLAGTGAAGGVFELAANRTIWPDPQPHSGDVAGGGDAVRILGVVSVIFALGVMGFCGSAVLGMIDKQKFGKLFERCCYMFAGILFFKEAINGANLFINFLMG